MTEASTDGRRANERRALELLGELLDVDPSHREQRLIELAERDEEIIQSARRLLALHDALDAAPGIFGRSAAQVLGTGETSDRAEPSIAIAAAIEHRYAIVGEIGRGGHAIVYRARELAHGRDVAIKTMRTRADADADARFSREVAIVARLQHPYLVPLLDSGSADGTRYFVMPFVAGESLRQCIDRSGALSVSMTLAIVSDLAEALDYAHANGVIHRDVKPPNILLREGHALLTDFGIAADDGADARLTGEGVAIGTPFYMSPEQVLATDAVDRRTDVYALACVAFEMLTGEPPYPGATAAAVQSRLLNGPIPDPRVLRPSLSPAVADVLARGMAKHVSERYESAGELATALRLALDASSARPGRRRVLVVRATLAASIAALLAAAVWRFPTLRDRLMPRVAAPASGGAIALLPLEQDNATVVDESQDFRLRAAFRRWNGLVLTDARRLDQLLERAPRGALGLKRAGQAARAAGASRYVLGVVAHSAGTTIVSASLYDASNDSVLAETATSIPDGDARPDSAYAALADRLLFGDLRTPEYSIAPIAGTDYAARRAFFSAHEAIARWDLAFAEAKLTDAINRDAASTNAWLWLALVRRWSGQPAARWTSAAELAATGRRNLSPRDSTLAMAMLSLAHDSIDAACRSLSSLAMQSATDFPSWFAVADCESKDHAVIRDARSPSGWRFRRSPYHAMLAYQRAFQLLPSAPTGLRPNGFDEARRLLGASANVLLAGRAVPPDTGLFFASPTLDRDTIRYVPVPAAVAMEGSASLARTAPRIGDAVRRQRELFRDLATAWVARYPQSAAAYEALGLSLQLLGEPAARDTLRQARRFAATPGDRLRTNITSALVELHIALPGDLAGLERARALADSALAQGGDGQLELASLASLAALTGRVELATRLASRVPRTGSHVISPLVWEASQTQLVYAGLHVDSAKALGLLARLDSLIGDGPPDARASWRRQTVERGVLVLLPTVGLSLATRFRDLDDPLLAAARSLASGDTSDARSRLARIAAGRALVPSTDLTFDTLLPEAWMHVQLGDHAGAARIVDGALSVQTASASGLASPVNGAALLQTMVFRARLADRMHDRATAARWAAAVVTLLAHADPALQPTLVEMRKLMS